MSTANHMQQVNVQGCVSGKGAPNKGQHQQNGGSAANSTGSTPPTGPLTNGPNSNAMAPQQPPPSQSASPPVNNAPKYGTLVPNRVFVGGISANTTEVELAQLFSAYGTVKATKIISDRAGVSKGYGFVTFESEEEAKRLQRESDNIMLRERRLNIAPAIKKQPFNRGFEVSSPPPAGVPGQTQFYYAAAAAAAGGVPYAYQNGMTYYTPAPPQTTGTNGDLSAAQPLYQAPPVYATPTAAPPAAPYHMPMYPPQPFIVQHQYPYQPIPYDPQQYYGGSGGGSGGGGGTNGGGGGGHYMYSAGNGSSGPGGSSGGNATVGGHGSNTNSGGGNSGGPNSGSSAGNGGSPTRSSGGGYHHHGGGQHASAGYQQQCQAAAYAAAAAACQQQPGPGGSGAAGTGGPGSVGSVDAATAAAAAAMYYNAAAAAAAMPLYNVAIDPTTGGIYTAEGLEHAAVMAPPQQVTEVIHIPSCDSMAQGTPPSYTGNAIHHMSHLTQAPTAQNHHQTNNVNQNSSTTPPSTHENISHNTQNTSQNTHRVPAVTYHHYQPNHHPHRNYQNHYQNNYYRQPNQSYHRPNNASMHKPNTRNSTPSPAYATGAPAQFRVPQPPMTTYVYPTRSNMNRNNQKCDNNHCRTWSKKRKGFTDNSSICSLRTDSNSSASAVDENLNEKKEGNGHVSPPPTPYSPMVNMERAAGGGLTTPPAQNAPTHFNHEVQQSNHSNHHGNNQQVTSGYYQSGGRRNRRNNPRRQQNNQNTSSNNSTQAAQEMGAGDAPLPNPDPVTDLCKKIDNINL